MKNAIIILISMSALSACKPLEDLKTRFLSGKKTLPTEVNHEMNQVSEEEKKQSAGELAKANSELLSEMMKVVFNEKEVEDKSNFGSLAHSLNQGASLEGIYRGIVMGSRYRGMEAKSKAASPAMLKAFSLEMAEIQSDMKNPSEFTQEARKAPTIDFPEAAGDIPTAAPHSQDVKEKKDKKTIINEMLQMFIGASPYTLKRVLADEAMKKMEEMKDSPGEFAQWYAKTTLRLIDTKVDFGLAQRNLPDFDFHFKFAQRMAHDRVQWEALNRYHRYLNAVMDRTN